MAQSKILTLAKQGNPKAIAALMNYSLRSKQITVVVNIADACLSVVATAPKPPDRAFMTHFVRKGLEKLRIEGLHRAIVEGYGMGLERPAWQETLMLDGATEITSNPFVGQIPLLSSLPEPSTSSSPPPPPPSKIRSKHRSRYIPIPPQSSDSRENQKTPTAGSAVD